MTDLPERWLPVVGFEGLYEVSSVGRVWSVPRRHAAGGLLKASPDSRGYRRVGLYKEGGQAYCAVHALVCEAFHGARPDGEETRHLDGDSLNNCATNLAWGTHSENELDAVRHGTHVHARKKYCKRRHEFTPENTRMEKGSRRCRTCAAANQERQKARRWPNAHQADLPVGEG